MHPHPAAPPDLLREDIRWFGHLLGQVIRESEGAATYRVIETLRRAAVKSQRTHASDRALVRSIQRLTEKNINPVVRAFSYFLPLWQGDSLAKNFHRWPVMMFFQKNLFLAY